MVPRGTSLLSVIKLLCVDDLKLSIRRVKAAVRDFHVLFIMAAPWYKSHMGTTASCPKDLDLTSAWKKGLCILN